MELPQIFLDIVEESGFLCPASIDDDLADVALYVWCQGTGAVVVLIVALAVVDGNEVMLDVMLYATWHVVGCCLLPAKLVVKNEI